MPIQCAWSIIQCRVIEDTWREEGEEGKRGTGDRAGECAFNSVYCLLCHRGVHARAHTHTMYLYALAVVSEREPGEVVEDEGGDEGREAAAGTLPPDPTSWAVCLEGVS